MIDVCVRLNQEVFGAGRVDLVDELVHPDFTDHAAPPGAPTGVESIHRTVGFIHEAFEDVRYEVHDAFAGDDRVALRVTMHGTHTGPLFGRPPTGRTFSAQQIHIFGMRDGRVAEHWATRDDAAMFRQLGLD